MKLVRYGHHSEEKFGLLDEQGKIRALSTRAGANLNAMTSESIDGLRGIDIGSLEVVEEYSRLGQCVAQVGKIVGVGLNYQQHAIEAGVDPPDQPVLFSKATSALSGPNDDVDLPWNVVKADWEVELAVVIGRRATNVTLDSALDYVAGYSIINDISDRALQLEGTGQWLKGKSLDRFAPLGPWLVTSDEIPDPQKLRMWLSVNDHVMQDSSTSDMLFPVDYLISFISQHMTLLPGDVIATGTPHGVGMGLNPPRYLKDGDVMRLAIEGLGEQCQVVHQVR